MFLYVKRIYNTPPFSKLLEKFMKKYITYHTRVVVIGNSKTKGRQGIVTNVHNNTAMVSVSIDATSDKPACNITILRKNVEAV